MPRKSNPKGMNALSKIIAYAKEYRKQHPSTAWKTCVKEGAAKYRKNKK